MSLLSFPPGYLDANHNAEIIAVCVLFMCLSTLSIIARFISKKMRKNPILIEDWLLCAAWIIALGNSTATVYSIRTFKLGYHIVSLDMEQVLTIPKSFFASNFVQSTSLFLSKLSLLIILWRIFITRAFRITTYILGSIVVLWWLAVILAGIFICAPIKLNWDPTAKGVCGNLDLLDKVAPIPWLLTDFAILVCPLPVIKQLKLSRQRRLGLYLIFSIGACTCIVTVVRYSRLFYSNADLTWDIVEISLLNVVECNITVICASLLACQPVLKYVFPSHLLSSLRSLFTSRTRNTSQDSHTFGRTGRATGAGISQSEENLRDLPIVGFNKLPSKEAQVPDVFELRSSDGSQEV